jgi:hypothetical protein
VAVAGSPRRAGERIDVPIKVPRFLSSRKAPPAVPMTMLEHIQQEAWREAGFLPRVDDPTFAYSAKFVVPRAVEISVLELITLAGQGPIKLRGPSPPSRFQERLTFPLLEAAYCRLHAAGAVPAGVALGSSLLIGTAPLASIYPSVARNQLDGTAAIVFGTGLLILHMLVGDVLACAGDGRPVQPTSLEQVICESSAEDLQRAATTLHGVAESLFGLVTQNWPYPEHGRNFECMRRHPFAAEFVSDAFAFCLSHELSHLSLGHFSGAAGIGSLEEREVEADLHALRGTLSSRQPANNTMPALIAVLVLFETMSLIYRVVNYLAFGIDYEFMPPARMGHLYFRAHAEDIHPHPRTRLTFLVMRLKAAHPEFADRIDTTSRQCHIFFDNIWTTVAGHFPVQRAAPSATWRSVVELHRRAHTASTTHPSTKE